MASGAGAFAPSLFDQGSRHAQQSLGRLPSEQLHPALHGHLHPAWRALRQWSNRFVPAIRRPMPVELLLSLAVAAVLQGWWRLSVGLLLGFHLLLRPGELAALRRNAILLPVDLGGSWQHGVVKVAQSKTATRFTLLQAVTIEDEKLLALLTALIGHDPPKSPLLPGGLPALQTRFSYLMSWLGCKQSGFTLASLRSGGATEFMLRTSNLGALQYRGRWTSSKTLQHYL
eukprot:2572515-Amphidinium_carterae.1